VTDLLHSKPRRTVEAPAERWSGGAVLRPPVQGPPVALNPTALALWELCDGQTAVAEMVEAVSTLFALDPGRARTDVENALEDMLAAGVIR
jgi:hypothetical protein